MARRGRCALTPEVQEKICEAIRLGNYLYVACQYAGISQRTLERWLKIGKESKTGKHVDFVEAFKKAEAKAEVDAVSTIRTAMGKNWQSAMTWLERRHPQRWAKREYVEAKNIDSTEMDNIARKAKDDPEVLDALIALQQKLDACEGNTGGAGKAGE